MSHSSSLVALFDIAQTFMWIFKSCAVFWRVRKVSQNTNQMCHWSSFQVPKDAILVYVAVRVMYTSTLQWTFPIVLVLFIVSNLLPYFIWLVSILKRPRQKLNIIPVKYSRKFYVLEAMTKYYLGYTFTLEKNLAIKTDHKFRDR